MTTPPAIELSRTLGTMVEHGCKSRARWRSRATRSIRGGPARSRIDAAGFTNLSGDHLDYHKTLDSVHPARKQRCSSSLDLWIQLLSRRSISMIPRAGSMIDACRDGVEVSALLDERIRHGGVVRRRFFRPFGRRHDAQDVDRRIPARGRSDPRSRSSGRIQCEQCVSSRWGLSDADPQ